MLGLAARLPDALVGLAPDRGRALGLRLHDRPQPARQPLAAPRVQQDRVQRGAEDVVLALVEGAVADADRARAGVAGEVVARGLGQVAAPVDPVHDLQRAVLVGLEVGDELHELVGLPVEVEVVQRLQGEGRVAHPGVAVVPVALAARRLGQRRGQRGHRRAGGHVGQALDRQRGALDRRHPLVVGKPGAGEPRAPEAGRLRQPRVGVVEVGRRGEALGPRQRAVELVALGEQVARAHRVALDAERHVRAQPDRLLGPAGVGDVAVVAHERPLARDAAVVEDGLAHELDLDVAVDAAHRADEQVLGVVVGRRPGVRRDGVLGAARAHGQRVAHDDPAARGVPRRLEDVGARLVAPAGRDVDPERGEAEVARLAVEQRPEHARRVEARDAEPADAAVGRDERAGVAVREERVLGDRRERRGRRGALRGGLRLVVDGAHEPTHGSCQRPWPASSRSASAGPPRALLVRVHRRRRVEQRLHDPPGLLDAVLAREARRVAAHGGRAAAPRRASAPRRPPRRTPCRG